MPQGLLYTMEPLFELQGPEFWDPRSSRGPTTVIKGPTSGTKGPSML